MPILSLKTVDAKLSQNLSHLPDQWRITLKAKLDSEDRLDLTTGEKVSDVEILANLTTPEFGHRDHYLKNFPGPHSSEAVGIAIYHSASGSEFASAPCTLFFETFLTDAQFADLIGFARHGRYPTRLTIVLASDLGITHGWEPDGSRKIWDTKSCPRVPIESVRCEMDISDGQAPAVASINVASTTPAGQPQFWQRLTFLLMIGILMLLLARRLSAN